MQGLFGGMFGKANAGTNALGDMAKKQMEQTITTATAQITAATVIVNGAVQGAAEATAVGTSAGDVQSIASTGTAGSASYASGVAALKAAMGGAGGSGSVGGSGGVPAMTPYNPNASLESMYGPGVHGMFGDKLSDGIGITDPRVAFAHPEINGDAIQKGLGDAFKKLGDGLGITKNGKYAPVQHPDFQQPGAGGGAAGGLGQVQGLMKGGQGQGQGQGMPFPQQATFGNLDAAKAAFGGAPAAMPGNGHDFYYNAMMHETGGKNIFNGGDPNSAAGYYQFMPKTWAGIRAQNPQLGLPDKAINASFAQQTAAYQKFTQGNVASLQANGLPVTDKNTFMESFFGPTKGPQFLKEMQQNPNALARDLLPTEAKANHGDFYDHKTGQPLTAQQLYDRETKNFSNGNTTGFGPRTSLQYSNDGVGLPRSGAGPGVTGALKTPDTSAMQNAMQQAQQVQNQLKQSLTASSSTFQSSFTSLSSNITKTGQSALGAVPDMGQFSKSISQMVSKLGVGRRGRLRRPVRRRRRRGRLRRLRDFVRSTRAASSARPSARRLSRRVNPGSLHRRAAVPRRSQRRRVPRDPPARRARADAVARRAQHRDHAAAWRTAWPTSPRRPARRSRRRRAQRGRINVQHERLHAQREQLPLFAVADHGLGSRLAYPRGRPAQLRSTMALIWYDGFDNYGQAARTSSRPSCARPAITWRCRSRATRTRLSVDFTRRGYGLALQPNVPALQRRPCRAVLGGASRSCSSASPICIDARDSSPGTRRRASRCSTSASASSKAEPATTVRSASRASLAVLIVNSDCSLTFTNHNGQSISAGVRRRDHHAEPVAVHRDRLRHD